MRRVNQAIISCVNHPLPTMEVLIPQLRKAISRLAIKNAFRQIEIS